MAAKKKTAPVVVKEIQPLARAWTTADDALQFELDYNEKGDVNVVVVEDPDGETPAEVTLALDRQGLDETIDILTKIKEAVRKHEAGEEVTDGESLEEDDAEEDDDDDAEESEEDDEAEEDETEEEETN